MEDPRPATGPLQQLGSFAMLIAFGFGVEPWIVGGGVANCEDPEPSSDQELTREACKPS